MKFYILILCFFTTQLQAEQKPSPSRLAMGFYYPALNNISTKTDINISLTYWIQELTTNLELDNVYSVLYKDIKKMSKDFSNGKLDMIVLPPLLITLNFDKSLLSDGFMGVNELGKMDHLVIIASQPPKSPFTGYQGKKLILPKDDLLAKFFLDSEVIKQHKQSYQTVFSKISQQHTNQKIILDVFFRKTDIAVVYESALRVMMEMNPQLKQKIKIITKFPIKARNYGYLYKKYRNQQKLREESIHFNTSAKGKKILEVFHASAIETCEVSYLNPFFILNKTYNTLKESLVK